MGLWPFSSGQDKLGKSLGRLGSAIVDAPGKAGTNMMGGSAAASGLSGGLARAMNVVSSFIEKRPTMATILGGLGAITIGYKMLKGPAPAVTEDGVSPEEAGRYLAEQQLMRADQAAAYDVNSAVMASMQSAHPMMDGGPSSALLQAGSGARIGGGTYQGRMQAPIEQNINLQ